MPRLSGPVIFCLGCALMGAGAARAQRGGADWSTGGNDAQRSSWLRADGKISKESMQKPGFKFIWKVKFANEPKQLNALTPAVVVQSYIGYRGFRSYAFIGGSSDNVFALDSDLGRLEWETHFATPSGLATAGSLACPGGMTSALTRVAQAAMAGAPGGRGGGGGRGGAARSGVGGAGEGAVTVANAGQPGRGAVPIPPPAAPGAPAAGAPDPAGRRGGGGGGFGGGRGGLQNSLFAVASDGMLRQIYISNGQDAQGPVKFLPPGANAMGLIVVDNVAYVATTNGCGGAANGMWALDLTSKEVASWKSTGGVAGSSGPAVGPDGTLYVATTDGPLAALEPKTLKAKGLYSAGGFTSSPVIFEYKDKTLIAAAAKDGRIHLLDAAKPETALFKSTVYTAAADFNAGSLASWQDADGTRWVLAPAAGPVTGFTPANGAVTNGAIVAWKVVDQNGAPALQAGWASRDMTSPLPPMVVNGVVFGVSSGELRGSDSTLTAAQRAQRSSRAVLYALDSATGKELWSSGTTITSFVHGGGLSAGGGQMYLGTYDGTLWAFGIPIEH